MSSVVQLKRKPAPQMQCLGCGEISDAPCECGVGWKAIVNELQEKVDAERERQRQKAKNWREKDKQNQQTRTGTRNTDPSDEPSEPKPTPEMHWDNLLNAPKEQSELRDLINEEQDQILHLVLVLLATVDHRHRKKFHDHLVENSVDGVFLPTCSHRGWKGAGYRIDPALLRRLWRSFEPSAEAVAGANASGVELATASAVEHDPETALRERAKRLGYQVRKRGAFFMLAGNGTSSDLDIAGANEWLDSIEEIAP
jgi:hypothetical protein